MLPSVNGKALFDCSEEDFSVLIDNPDYRENEYLDYKLNFSFLEGSKNDPKREKHIAEFRSDVCAFANADGGYLVYGIRDDKGMATEIVGITIPENDTDQFELSRKNNLSVIMPKIPSIRFRFIQLKNGKYLVILHVQKDFYTPYIHVHGEINYRIFKRVGNGKQCVGYAELKNLFNHSLSIEKEIRRFREDRILEYKSNEDTDDCRYSQFLLLHIMPDTFVDSSHNKNLFLIERGSQQGFSGIFGSVGCSGTSVPNVDGLRFPSYQSGEECRINNNCVAEVFQPLRESLNFGTKGNSYGSFSTTYIWDRIEQVVRGYIEKMKNILETQRVYVCISIIGCKNVVTENVFINDYNGKIDRDMVICSPVVFENIADDDLVELCIKRLHIEYALSLGIKYSGTLKRLIQEAYE